MKTIALAITMLSCALQAETRLNFIIQSNNPLCIGELPLSSLTCPPPELWKAGIMAMVANDDPAVVAYLITVTAKLSDGSPFVGSTVAEKWPAPTVYTAAVIWIGKEPSDFTDVRVSVETLRKDPGKVEVVTPGIEVVASAVRSSTYELGQSLRHLPFSAVFTGPETKEVHVVAGTKIYITKKEK